MKIHEDRFIWAIILIISISIITSLPFKPFGLKYFLALYLIVVTNWSYPLRELIK